MAQSSTTSELRRLQLGHEGVRLVLCSKINEAEELFKKTRFKGPQLHAGYSSVIFLKSLMTFDEDSMEKAYKMLESTEKFCDVGDGVFGQMFKDQTRRAEIHNLTPHEKLCRKCIIADCLLFEAILAFLKQGIAGYIKGGFILRKAWKMYVKVYHEAEKLCATPSPITPGSSSPLADDDHDGIEDNGQPTNGTVENGYGIGEAGISTTNGGKATEMLENLTLVENFPIGAAPVNSGGVDSIDVGDESNDLLETAQSIASVPVAAKPIDLMSVPWEDDNYVFESPVKELQDQDTRLRAAVYFGYGIMNLCISLIPPKLLKVANLLGFRGDRQFGLQALKYVSNSQDIKAPLARLALLWYHTIIRPFFALDDKQDAGVPEASVILLQAEKDYPDSAIFQYFKGRILSLQGHLPEALMMYTRAAEAAHEQREIEHICLYEKGWMHMLQLQWEETIPCFLRLKNETRWSACYYAFLAAIVTGASGDIAKSRELFLQSAKLVKRKTNNLEKFCARRSSWYKKGPTPLMKQEAMLMTIEVIYLWRALPNCSTETKEKIIEILKGTEVAGVNGFHVGLRCLLLGATLGTLGRLDEAEQILRKTYQCEAALKHHDKHILSFATYELGSIYFERQEEEWSGYEFEARLLFKVHSALLGLRELGYS